jgi:NAD(P)H-hydrate epimerase
LFDWVLSQDLPAVIDADGLNILAGRGLPAGRAPAAGARVLTPHPGEAARLLGWELARVESDRFAAVRSLQQHFGGVVVLKGAGTLVSSHGAEAVTVCQSGNPGMASGGMGDILTGVIAGLAAQGLTLPAAARAGAWLHGAAADRAVVDGERGLLAGDLFPHLRRLVNSR